MAAGDGSNYAGPDWGAYQLANELKNNFAGATAPANPVAGVLWYDTGASELKIYNGSAWGSAAGATGAAPVGSIVPVVMGYMTDGSNGGYTRVLGASNDAAGVNGYYNAKGWYVCNGAAVNVAGSQIWNAASRYVPNLTDDRFIEGSSATGATGGSSTMAHTHTADPPSTVSSGPSSTAGADDISALETVAEADHTHTVDIASTTSGGASVTENRPLYLACIYIVRVF